MPGDHHTPWTLAGEKETLADFLDYLRGAVIRKASGLPAAAVRRPMTGSGTSLLGLVKHLTRVEIAWFQYAFAGADVRVPGDDLADDDEPQSVIDDYQMAVTVSNRIVAEAADLTQSAKRRAVAPELMSLRWILVHMIEETGRHAGHADILREQIDRDDQRSSDTLWLPWFRGGLGVVPGPGTRPDLRFGRRRSGCLSGGLSAGSQSWHRRRCRPDLPGLGRGRGSRVRRPAGACHPSTVKGTAMTTMVEDARMITGGVDTHAGMHVAAALDSIGGLLGVQEFPATAAGYASLLSWLRSFGTLAVAGVEGTGS